MSKTISRFFEEVEVTTAGLELNNIINTSRGLLSGSLKQVVVSLFAGAATEVDIRLRYESGVDDNDKLIYSFTAASLPEFVDSGISGCFDVTRPQVDGDIFLYLEPDADCTLNIRLDFELDRP